MAEPYFTQQNIYGKNCGMFFINMVAPRVHRYWCIRAPLLSYHAVRSILITESYTLLLYFSSECPQWFMKEVKHITIVPDIDNNWERGSNAMSLEIHLASRALSTNKPLARDDPLSLSKFAAEGSMSEVLTVLGWQLNFWSLEISLPRDKFLAWQAGICQIIQEKKASTKPLKLCWAG
jgi:hypothetical protein